MPKPFTYVSVCSGIEAASVAWEPLGWRGLAVAEVDKAANAVLAHRWPGIPNVGDFTKVKGDEYGTVDVLVGGTPCQDFSVAGLRAGMDGDRGNLTLEFLRLAGRMRPKWLVWENVPGVLSSTSHGVPPLRPPPDPLDMECDGQEVDVEDEYSATELHAFNSFVAGLSELGYGWAMRVLDAQHFGVPHRRRRVFVVGHFRDWRCAAAVLFERHSLSGHPPPRREAGQSVTHELAPSLTGSGRGVERTGESRGQDPVVAVHHGEPVCMATGQGSAEIGIRPPLVPVGVTIHGTDGTARVASYTDLAGALRARTPGGAENSSTTAVLAFAPEIGQTMTSGGNGERGRVSPTLRGMAHDGSHANAGGQVAVAFTQNQAGDVLTGEVMHSLGTNSNATGRNATNVAYGVRDEMTPKVMEETMPTLLGRERGGGEMQFALTRAMAVRRLTPRECERLQGFPDDYTLVPYGRKMMADGPRYKMLGNSMAVPCMRWRGKRIKLVEALHG